MNVNFSLSMIWSALTLMVAPPMLAGALVKPLRLGS